jgi:hypothetical protein
VLEERLGVHAPALAASYVAASDASGARLLMPPFGLVLHEGHSHAQA